MPRLSKKQKEEWSFFICPETGRRKYNDVCCSCTEKCKQSFRTDVIECRRYRSKRAEYYKQALKKR